MQEEASTSIVKADRSGRTRYTDQYKAEVVEAFADSGLSGPAFARQCGVKYPTFAAWAANTRNLSTRNLSVPGKHPVSTHAGWCGTGELITPRDPIIP